jgi:hypothetical protein
MTRPARILAFLFPLLLAASGGALGQVAALTPAQLAAQQVTALAPQLAAFAGSPANLQALAAGLVLGQPIVMTATTPDGISQLVTVNAFGTMTPAVAAQALERARQALIARGIAQPTPEQIGVALTGGTLPTPVGNALVAGTLTGTVNPAAMLVQRQVAGLSPTGPNAANVQSLLTGLTSGQPITLAGTTPAGAPTQLTFGIPGGAMSAAEASQTLQFASQLLATQGITNPTPEQVRAALLGGTVNTPAGAVALRGVLEGRGTPQTAISTFGTSFSPAFTFNTSASPIVGTSNSPTTVVPGAAAAGAAGSPNGAPSIAVQMQGRR